ncbi:carbohydrate esterase-like sialic acid-specific acetylesterase [Kribbella amoyensis]|uniref:Carbohydrate esterase-like sialic acid-specific acetylesterase n=1 Tax=Kribbella amoyensis TaxID=996641 RepID=A0A561BMU8_9ACTN|nr:sialate O-acetylesterase [Kribbella amoyensis]TWD80157.1 carbohydrate esterase-like sialic acid-specific acetylesterase [Kribbella amoyensis]
MPRPAPVRANPGSIVTALTTVLATALAGTAVIAPASAAPAAAATACDAAAAGFTPVLQLDVPARANYLNQAPPYAIDRTGEVPTFDRVGYCVELNGPDGPQWVWTAMEPFTTDARRIGLPTRPGELVRQRVGDLEVRSNVPSVSTGTGKTGYLEMWPNQYQSSASTQVANGSPQTYDADDNPTSPLGYGSFQVAQIGATRPSTVAAQQVFSINTFTESDNGQLSLGIGTNLAGQPDWTFANNAERYSQRRFTAYVRTSPVKVTESPQDRQLVPRDRQNGAVVPVAGEVVDQRVRRVQLRVTGNGRTETFTSSARTFRFTPRIKAGLHEYTFELRATGPGIDRVVAHREGVVAGDVVVVQGQSNAEAAKFNGNANGEESPYLRSFGSPTSDGSISGADRVWHYATGDVTNQSGSVGQWAIRMGRRLVDTYKVPIAMFNGAHGGRPIDFFQRNDANPDDPATNYGRLRQRLEAAGVIDQVKAVLWYQGESDNNNASVHINGFTSLLADWRADLGTAVPGGARYYVHQVRTSPCGNTTSVDLREAQRQLGDTAGVIVLSTNGLSGHDGCHYAYLGGYRDLGDHAFAVLARDLYGGASAGVAAPNPSAVTANGTQLVVQLRSTDPLTVESGVAADFVVEGAAVTVSSVAYEAGGKLVLTLSGPADGVTGLTYQGHLRAGPWITNATGVGLLAFKLPVTP